MRQEKKTVNVKLTFQSFSLRTSLLPQFHSSSFQIVTVTQSTVFIFFHAACTSFLALASFTTNVKTDSKFSRKRKPSQIGCRAHISFIYVLLIKYFLLTPVSSDWCRASTLPRVWAKCPLSASLEVTWWPQSSCLCHVFHYYCSDAGSYWLIKAKC